MRRMIRKAELLDAVSLSYTTIWSLMRKGEFPRSVDVAGCAMWYEDEIRVWQDSRPRRTLKGDKAA